MAVVKSTESNYLVDGVYFNLNEPVTVEDPTELLKLDGFVLVETSL